MAMYSMIQFGAVIMVYFVGSNLGDWQYLYEDLWLVFPLVILMGGTEARRSLSVKRPSGNLLSKANIANVLIHALIGCTFQTIIFESVKHASGYTLNNADNGQNPDNGAYTWETTSLYYFSNFQYIVLAFLFSLGHPWKKAPWTNWMLTGWLIVTLITSFLILFVYDDAVFLFRDDVPLGGDWRKQIGLWIGLYTLAAVVFEVMVYPILVTTLKKAALVGARYADGSVFGRGGGQQSKVYHRLRQAFEKGWPARGGQIDSEAMRRSSIYKSPIVRMDVSPANKAL